MKTGQIRPKFMVDTWYLQHNAPPNRALSGPVVRVMLPFKKSPHEGIVLHCFQGLACRVRQRILRFPRGARVMYTEYPSSV